MEREFALLLVFLTTGRRGILHNSRHSLVLGGCAGVRVATCEYVSRQNEANHFCKAHFVCGSEFESHPVGNLVNLVGFIVKFDDQIESSAYVLYLLLSRFTSLGATFMDSCFVVTAVPLHIQFSVPTAISISPARKIHPHRRKAIYYHP